MQYQICKICTNEMCKIYVLYASIYKICKSQICIYMQISICIYMQKYVEICKTEYA